MGKVNGTMYRVEDALGDSYWTMERNSIEFYKDQITGQSQTAIKKESFYFTKPPAKSQEAYAEGKWLPYETSSEAHVRLNNGVANGIGTGVFVGALVIAAAPLTPLLAKIGSHRLASAGADGLMQYINNAPNKGWGWNNIGNINITSVALSAAMPSSNWVAGYGSSALETNLIGGYQGLGSGNKQVKDVVIEGTINTFGNLLGNKFGSVATKYSNWNKTSTEGAGNVLGNGVSNSIQTIVNEATKNLEKLKND